MCIQEPLKIGVAEPWQLRLIYAPGLRKVGGVVWRYKWGECPEGERGDL